MSPDFESELGPALLRYAVTKRWFRGKSRTVKDARIVDRLALGRHENDPVIMLFRIDYMEGDPDLYSIPIALCIGEEAERREQRSPHALIARIQMQEPPEGVPGTGALFDAFATGEATWSLISTMAEGPAAGTPPTTAARRDAGRLIGEGSQALSELLTVEPRPPVRAPELEQTNTVLFVGEKVMLKVYRQIETGINAELEVGRYLSARSEGRVTPRVLGAIQYAQRGRENRPSSSWPAGISPSPASWANAPGRCTTC
jgi:maltose alpha-D-glucosyltransferase/alpha-amylase